MKLTDEINVKPGTFAVLCVYSLAAYAALATLQQIFPAMNLFPAAVVIVGITSGLAYRKISKMANCISGTAAHSIDDDFLFENADLMDIRIKPCNSYHCESDDPQ